MYVAIVTSIIIIVMYDTNSCATVLWPDRLRKSLSLFATIDLHFNTT